MSFVLNRAKTVIANSNYTKEVVRKYSKKSNVVAVPLAVDELRFKPYMKRTDAQYLCLSSISRLEKYKGHDFIIETISELPTEYRNRIKFNIAGRGTYSKQLQDQISRLNLENTVTILGFIDKEKLCEFYNSSDIFILCTREDSVHNKVEGFGLVFLEAQACGVPVIGTNTGGISDAIEHGNGGWLIESDNKKQLTELLVRLIDAPWEIEEFGRRARKRVESVFTWESYYDRIIAVIEN